MQDTKKNSIDTRSLPDFYKALTPVEQQYLRQKLADDCGVTDRTTLNWVCGTKYPKALTTRKAICDSVRKAFKTNLHWKTVF